MSDRYLAGLGWLPVFPSLAVVVVSLVLAGHWAGGRWMMGWWWEITASFWWSNSDHSGSCGILCSGSGPRCDFCLRTRPRWR